MKVMITLMRNIQVIKGCSHFFYCLIREKAIFDLIKNRSINTHAFMRLFIFMEHIDSVFLLDIFHCLLM